MDRDRGWAETRTGMGLLGAWPGCHPSEGSGLPLSFLPSLCLLPFLSIFHTVLMSFWSSLLLPWSSLHSTLCSLEQSYYRNLINNKFQRSDRSIKCMIRRGHYSKWKMHKRMPTAWVNLQPGEAGAHETSNAKRDILGHLEAFISPAMPGAGHWTCRDILYPGAEQFSQGDRWCSYSSL